MVWFLERDTDLMTCEIRRAAEGSSYEFEIAPAGGPAEKSSFASPTELIAEHLRRQSSLQRQG
jgi:hypothetical protein